MRLTKYVEKTTTYKTDVLTGVKCDVCGKDIKEYEVFWRLCTHHRDWGNDSVDSYEYFDLCGNDCVKVKLDEYMERCKESYTQHFELTEDYYKIGQNE